MSTCRYFTLSVALLLTFASSAGTEEILDHSLVATRVVDLTQALYDEMPFWPGGVAFTKTQLVGYEDGYLLHKFEMAENTGTHVDAPAHFVEGKTSIDRLALSDLIVPAIVIDIQEKTAGNADYALAVSDIERWENQHGRIPARTLVLLNTGWHKRFGSAERYINMDAGNVMHFPGFGADAAELLIERDVVGIGIDTLSIDPGASATFAAHQVMLNSDKYQLENLTGLDELPPTGATVVVGVLPVKNGSQAQARVLALLP